MLLAKTKFGDGMIVGWCYDNNKCSTQAIVVLTTGKCVDVGLNEFTLLNIPRKLMKQALKLAKQDQKENRLNG